MKKRTLAIIGGGAAGLIAALRAKQISPALEVLVLEKNPRVGKKLLATGNGRCNLTNRRADDTAHYFGDIEQAAPILRDWSPARVLAFFASIGLVTAAEEDRFYPYSQQATSVLDALRLALMECGISEETDFAACALHQAAGGFRVEAADGRRIFAHAVLLSTGGLAAPALGASGDGYRLAAPHALSPTRPALTPIETDAAPIRALKGIRARAAVSLLNKHGAPVCPGQSGEVLFTEYGLSGIAAMGLSRHAKKSMTLSLDLLPHLPSIEDLWHERLLAFPERTLLTFFTGLLPARLAQAVIVHAGFTPPAPIAALSRDDAQALFDTARAFRLPVLGTRPYEQAQVTAGGLTLDAFCPATLESRLIPGLFAAGEVLNIDGECGGFNLHWAWASGLTAGEAAAKKLSGAGELDAQGFTATTPSRPAPPRPAKPAKQTHAGTAPQKPSGLPHQEAAKGAAQWQKPHASCKQGAAHGAPSLAKQGPSGSTARDLPDTDTLEPSGFPAQKASDAVAHKRADAHRQRPSASNTPERTSGARKPSASATKKPSGSSKQERSNYNAQRRPGR